MTQQIMLRGHYLYLPRILVLSGGHLKEYDSPASLREKPLSDFYKMVSEAGLLAFAVSPNTIGVPGLCQDLR